MHTTKTRLAIAGRIAAGNMAHPQAFVGGDWENQIARHAWSLAGKLCRMAEQHEAEIQPEAVAANAAAYRKAGG